MNDLHDDVVVYAHPDGRDYPFDSLRSLRASSALFGERWLRWPADPFDSLRSCGARMYVSAEPTSLRVDGWARRQGCSATTVDPFDSLRSLRASCWELEPRPHSTSLRAALALRLSGVTA